MPTFNTLLQASGLDQVSQGCIQSSFKYLQQTFWSTFSCAFPPSWWRNRSLDPLRNSASDCCLLAFHCAPLRSLLSTLNTSVIIHPALSFLFSRLKKPTTPVSPHTSWAATLKLSSPARSVMSDFNYLLLNARRFKPDNPTNLPLSYRAERCSPSTLVLNEWEGSYSSCTYHFSGKLGQNVALL